MPPGGPGDGSSLPARARQITTRVLHAPRLSTDLVVTAAFTPTFSRPDVRSVIAGDVGLRGVGHSNQPRETSVRRDALTLVAA